MDDTFLRMVAALQANLELLDSNQDALSDFQDMQALRRLKADLADYIAGHAAKGELSPDPLADIKLRLAALNPFFQLAESESRRLLDWKADWLNGVPRVGLANLQHAGTELAGLAQQLPSLQERLRGVLDPRDWDVAGNAPSLHPELRICAETVPKLKLPNAESCAELHGFAHGTGRLHDRVKGHFSRMDKRIENLLRLHGIHQSKVAEAEDHLGKGNFRSAEQVMGSIGKEPFADIDYQKVEAVLEKQRGLLRRFENAGTSVDQKHEKGGFKIVCAELEALRGLNFISGSQLEGECQALLNTATAKAKAHAAELRSARNKRIAGVGIVAIIVLCVCIYAREAAAKAEREAAEAIAKAEREAPEVIAKAERDAAETYKSQRGNRGGDAREFRISSGSDISFRWCPPGFFTMGSPASENDRSSDRDQVPVTLSTGFWLAETEVTQAQWEAVMGGNPSHFKGDHLPVETVSWDDAREFIQKINASGMIPAGWKLALPTEAQWEYACRAGETGPYSGGTLDEVAWYDGNSGGTTHPVGNKKANAWGLHDMHGNVWEWCADWYEDELPGGTDPAGAASGVNRVLRGGSWYRNAANCRAALRNGYTPDIRFSTLGFRPALVPSE